MENKEERNIVDLNNENIKKYSFVLTDEINGQKYKVEYEPIFLYEKDKYIYGMFTNFKKDEKDNSLIVGDDFNSFGNRAASGKRKKFHRGITRFALVCPTDGGLE